MAPNPTSAPTQLASEMDAPKDGLPVTIITGFLGSGKTTLLNHILTNQAGLKTAVLVNEFGEIGIDNELIVTTGENMVELSNGCICCTINDDLREAVLRVLERSDVDYLVVETTGLADPAPLAITFLSTELADFTRLDSIVTVIDAANFSLDLFNSEAALNQILYGDILLLNKTDLVSEAELERLEERVRDLKPGARILRTNHSQVPLPLILSVGLFQSEQYFGSQAKTHEHEHQEHEHHDHDHDHEHCEHPDHDHGHHHPHHASNHLENDGFISVSFQAEKPLDLAKFQNFLDQMPENVFRAKGILWFTGKPDRYVFHLSGKRLSLDNTEWQGPKKNQLVLIGQNLEREPLLAQLNGCIADTVATRPKPRGFGR